MSNNNNNKTYIRRNGLLIQRALEVAQYPTVQEALADREMRLSPSELVIVIGDHGKVMSLNLVAAFVWDLLDGKHTLEQLIESIVNAFRVSRITATRDLQELIEKLVRSDLIRLVKQ